jgi:hypothetical protein
VFPLAVFCIGRDSAKAALKKESHLKTMCYDFQKTSSPTWQITNFYQKAKFYVAKRPIFD